ADAGGLKEVLSAATAAPVDEMPANVSVYALKNGLSVDALVEYYRSGSDEKAGSVRTYKDTGYVYLPAGIYDMKVTPLEGSDVSPISIPGVVARADTVTHTTASLDG